MPRIMDNEQVFQGRGGAFTFSGVRPDRLEETRYTLVVVAVDTSGSTHSFAPQLLDMLRAVVNGCKKSPTADNIMLSLITFNSGVTEAHGYRLVKDIDPAAYPDFTCGGLTALLDAVYQGCTSMHDYAKALADQDFDVNGVIYIITDGAENASSASPSMVKDALERAVRDELVDSFKSILIGVNNAACSREQAAFVATVGISEFVDVGDATPGRLAKLGAFISKSISSTSQSLGTGQPASLTF